MASGSHGAPHIAQISGNRVTLKTPGPIEELITESKMPISGGEIGGYVVFLLQEPQIGWEL